MSRIEKALKHLDLDGPGLEIGPSHSPIAPKRAGYDVKVVDYLDQLQLIDKFRAEGVDTDAIEPVDFVWKGERLPDLVGREKRYSWIIASHVIEHIPNLIGFFRDCQEVLAEDGVLSLIIPDKRNCFDHFRPLTTTGDLLDAFADSRARPLPGAVFEHAVNAVRLDGRIAWCGTDKGSYTSMYSFDEAAALWNTATTNREYMDAHVWRFIPDSFHLIVDDLNRLQLTRMHIVGSFDTEGHEFHMSLSPNDVSKCDPPPRVEALARIEGALCPDRATPSAPVQSASVPQTVDQTDGGRFMRVGAREAAVIMAKRRLIERIRAVLKTRN